MPACRASRAATSTTPPSPAAHARRAACPAPGSRRRSLRTSCTPRAPPASPRACSAIPAATRWRWPASMRDIFCLAAGRDDVHHQRHRLGRRALLHRLRAAASTARRRILYEGLPIRPDPGIWWQIVDEYQVRTMFSSPTAIRVLKKQDPAYMKKHDLSCLRYLFLAGEPLDEPTARWAAESLGVPVIDNYWQTESGWPILSAQLGIEDTPRKFGSPSFAGVRLRREAAARSHRRGGRRRREGRAGDRAAAAAGLHDDHLGRRRALRADLFLDAFPGARCTRRSTGACATRTAITSSSAAPTT